MAMPDPLGPLSHAETLTAAALKQSAQFNAFILRDGLTLEESYAAGINFEVIERPNPEVEAFTVQQLSDQRPLVCIYPDDLTLSRAASNTIQSAGRVRVLLEANYLQAAVEDPSLASEQERLRWWKNKTGQMLWEMFSASHDSGWTIQRIEEFDYWTRNVLDPDNQMFGMTCLLYWGVE